MKTLLRSLRLLLVALGAVGLFSLAGCSRSAFWAPDSRSLALDLGGVLRLFDLGSRQFTVLPTAGHVVNPVYSPDGRRLAYYSITVRDGKPETCDLTLRDLAAPGPAERLLGDSGLGVERVPSLEEIASSAKLLLVPAWRPDGGALAYPTVVEDNVGEIEIRDLDTGRTRSLGRYGEAQFYPSWSPDGRRIAYFAEGRTRRPRSRPEPSLLLYVTDADGQNRRCVWDTALRGELWPYAPVTWAPDGNSLIVLKERGAENALELRRISLAGGADSMLTLFTTPLGSVAPDLSAVVYTGGEGLPAIVYKAAPFTAAKILDRIPGDSGVSPEEGANAGVFPVLSPDGKWVALPLTTTRQELRLYEVATGRRGIYPVR